MPEATEFQQDPTSEFDPDSPAEQPGDALNALINRIEAEKLRLQLDRFGQADAVTLGQMLMALGTERKLPIAIDIRRGKHVWFHASLPGATQDNDVWIAKKSLTAERHAEPSLLVGLRGRLGGGSLEDKGWFDQKRYSPHGGAFPVYVVGIGSVATVTVSGLPQKADHDLVVEALTSFRKLREGA